MVSKGSVAIKPLLRKRLECVSCDFLETVLDLFEKLEVYFHG
jgi:hypothetical protein